MLSCFSHIWLFTTLWTVVARQAPLCMGFSRQEDWSGLPCPPPGDLPDSGIEPTSLMSPALAGGLFTTSATWETHTFSKSWLFTYSWLQKIGVSTRKTRACGQRMSPLISVNKGCKTLRHSSLPPSHPDGTEQWLRGEADRLPLQWLCALRGHRAQNKYSGPTKEIISIIPGSGIFPCVDSTKFSSLRYLVSFD